VNVLKTKADRGINTIKLRYVSVKPKVMLKPGRTRAGFCKTVEKNNGMRGEWRKSA
jgi:hypothetical protein